MLLSFIGLFISQILTSLERKSLYIATPQLIIDYDYTKIQIGLISSSFSFTYGIGKFLGGFLSDIIETEIILFVCILFSSISVYIFGYLSNHFNGLIICWIIHGILQGISGPALNKYCNNLETKNDLVWSILMFGSNLGYLLGPFILNNSNCWQMFKNLGLSFYIKIIIHNDYNLIIILLLTIISYNQDYLVLLYRL